MKYYLFDAGDGTKFFKLSEVRLHLYLYSLRDRLQMNNTVIYEINKDEITSYRTVKISRKGKITISHKFKDWSIK